ncbi:MAG: 2-amino-4-hydroxy-6-hydroxymethyldihydropteridine diphosphokinase [Armatimonadota bacterium]|nr:MAG: 2-amino-4-hydroxy-6-hydroxymethyldihydropteridine diphosphokinase [Armatimonadota bacterium]
MSANAWLSLGSNQGNRLSNLREAIRRLHTPQVQVIRCASVYETEPVGYDTPQPFYLNTAVQVFTTLEPLALLEYVMATEQAGGRVRTYYGNPRTIDIDIVLYEGVQMQTERLTLPHPRMHERAFVLIPLLEIAPELTLPDGTPIRRLLEQPEVRAQKVWKIHDADLSL